jgi:hypothetical protein
MWRGTILSLALVGICSQWGTAAESGDDRRRAFLEQCSAVQQEIYEQRRLLNELFEEQLREGVETGAWSDGDRVVALDSHAEILTPVPAEISNTSDALRRSRAKRASDRPRVYPIATLRATTAIESWFLLHRYHLDGLFDSVTHWQAGVALEYAENVWLNAQKAEDLAVAVRPLLDARERGLRWPMNALMRRSSGAPPRHFAGVRPSLQADAVHTFDAWTIVASPDGLLPPDPETASAAEFYQWRDTWNAVLQVRNTFLARPGIAARSIEVQAKRNAAEASGMDAVNQLILADAPVAAIEEPLKSIRYLVGGIVLPGRPSAPNSASPGGEVRDYRDLLRDVSSGRPGLPLQLPGISSDWFGACNLYLRWRKAAESRSEDLEKTRSELQKSLNNLSPRVAAHIRKQLGVPAPVPPADDEELIPEIIPGQEVETLAAALEKLAKAGNRPGDVNGEFIALAGVIRSELAPEPSARGASERFDRQWLALAGMPKARRLIPLRDVAIRAQLDKLGIAKAGDPVDPALLIWREAIAKEAEAGRLEVVAKLLDLDRRYSIVPMEEAREWSQFLALVQTPSNAQNTRLGLRAQLPRSSPALMRVIALRLKAAGGG